MMQEQRMLPHKIGVVIVLVSFFVEQNSLSDLVVWDLLQKAL